MTSACHSSMRTKVLVPRIHVKPSTNICSPSVPRVTRGSLACHGPASLAFQVGKQQRDPASNKVEAED